MHYDLLCCDFQHPAALCQLSELIMIVAVIVIGLLEGSQRRVEHVAGDHTKVIHQAFLVRIEPHHVLLNQAFQA